MLQLPPIYRSLVSICFTHTEVVVSMPCIGSLRVFMFVSNIHINARRNEHMFVYNLD